MKRSATLVAMFCSAMVTFGHAQAASETAGPAADPLQATMQHVLRAVDSAEAAVPKMQAAAEAAAKVWIGGADLFAGGDASLTDEAFYRAGGLVGLRRIAGFKQSLNGHTVRWADVPEESVVLYGLYRNADPSLVLFDELPHLAWEKDTVVLFASSRWRVTQKVTKFLQARLPAGKFFFIDTDLPADTRLRTAGGAVYGDFAPMATAAHLWAFTAELVSACTRQGRMPTMYPSGAIPKYQAWEKKYENTRFHDDFVVEPIAPTVLAREFLQIVRKQVEACAGSAPQLKAAARLLAEVPPEKTVYLMVESHLMASEAAIPAELSNWLLVQRSWRWNRADRSVEPGDAVVWLGYLDWPGFRPDRAPRKDNPLVGITVWGPGQKVEKEPLVTPADSDPAAQIRDAADAVVRAVRAVAATPVAGPTTLPAGQVWVPAPWAYPDAAVEIPGYPLPICPTSGIVQGTLLWGLIGEVVQEVDKAGRVVSNEVER